MGCFIGRYFHRVSASVLGGVLFSYALQSTFSPSPAIAQIRPDSTLGNERSQVRGDRLVRGRPADLIEGGARRGGNLFHSFSDFNVQEGQRVYFANPTGIENILSRVTGQNISNILGTLGVDGGANLYLLNPNGILFGSNARLDIQGSFVAGTTDSVAFADGVLFRASETQTAPLLTLAVPVGLQYGAQPPGAIANAGTLAVGQGQRLSLLGGTVTSTGQLIAPGGTVEVLGDRIALLENARIDVSGETGGGTVLIGGDFQGRGAVTTADRTFIGSGVTINADALNSGNGGRVAVWANEVTGFYGNISARGGASIGNGGFVEVSGKQELIYRGTVNTNALNGYTGTLLLDPNNITVVNGTGGLDDDQLNVSVPTPGDIQGQILSGDGLSGSFTISELALEALPNTTNVVIEATDNITINDLADNQLFFQSAFALPPGNGGSVTFRADADGNGIGSFVMNLNDQVAAQSRNLTISGSSVTAGALSTSSAPTTSGSIDVVATFGDLYINGYVNATSVDSAAGSISLRAPNGNITVNNSPFGLDTRSTFGNTGTILVEAENDITINGFVTSNIEGNATFSVGNIIISSRAGTIDSGRIDSSSGGNGGTINLNSAGTIRVVGDVVSRSRNIGNGGEIVFESTNGGIEIQSGTIDSRANAGDGGGIDVESSGAIAINGDILSSSTIGNAGDVRLISQQGSIDTTAGTNTGILNASSTFLSGNGGDVILQADSDISSGSIESIGLRGGSITVNSGGAFRLIEDDIASITAGSVQGGDIVLRARSLHLRDARIASFTLGQEQAGDVRVTISDQINILNTDNASPENIANQSALLSFFRQQPDFQGTGLITSTGGSGDAGELVVNTSRLFIRNRARLNPNELAGIATLTLVGTHGDAGNLSVQASERIEITGNQPGAFVATSIIDTPIQINNINTGLTSATQGRGTAGNLNIITGELVIRNGAAASSGNSRNGGILVGTGGGNTLSVTADSIELRGLAALATSTFSSENAGDLVVNADEVRLLDGAVLGVDTFGSGDAGDINLTTTNLNVLSGSRISAATAGGGRGGTITINAREAINVDGTSSDRTVRSGIFTTSQTDNSNSVPGIGGNINISTNRLTLSNRGEIGVSGVGSGIPGDLFVNANDIFLNSQARLTGRVTPSPGEVGATEGGNITLRVQRDIRMSNDGGSEPTEITTQASETSRGGIISMFVGRAVLADLDENSDIVADADRGQGGFVFVSGLNSENDPLVAQFRQYNGQRSPQSDFTAASVDGPPGTVVVPGNPRPPLPTQPVLPQIDQVCPVSQGVSTRAAGSSEFFNTGRGGLPTNPTQPLESNAVEVPWVTLDAEENNIGGSSVTHQPADPTEESPEQSNTSPDVIAEAYGWERLPDGEFLLVSAVPTSVPTGCRFEPGE